LSSSRLNDNPAGSTMTSETRSNIIANLEGRNEETGIHELLEILFLSLVH